MDILEKHPELAQFLDDSDEYKNSGEEFISGGDRFLIVTQASDSDAGQVLFKQLNNEWVPVDSDNAVDIQNNSIEAAKIPMSGTCGPSTPTDHAAVFKLCVEQVDKFSSTTGPDKGNLACVWAVRHLIHKALGRWVTKTNGTAVFGPELLQCFGSTSDGSEVSAGGIIISPTQTIGKKRNIGHVGILGENGDGVSRLIYSNSSGAAVWKQNHTLGSWIARYRDKKKLKVLFFPLPLKGQKLVS